MPGDSDSDSDSDSVPNTDPDADGVPDHDSPADGRSDGTAAEPTSGFELREHTADVGVAAFGETLEGVFEALANGLAAACCDAIPDDGGDRFDVSAHAESRDALLFEYLDELIYQRDVRLELPVENEVSIDGPRGRSSNYRTESEAEWSLEASARGVPLSAIDAREVKAVTYSEMRLEEVTEGWEGYVVFDV